MYVQFFKPFGHRRSDAGDVLDARRQGELHGLFLLKSVKEWNKRRCDERDRGNDDHDFPKPFVFSKKVHT